jgi:hypothetical protein
MYKTKNGLRNHLRKYVHVTPVSLPVPPATVETVETVQVQVQVQREPEGDQDDDLEYDQEEDDQDDDLEYDQEEDDQDDDLEYDQEEDDQDDDLEYDQEEDDEDGPEYEQDEDDCCPVLSLSVFDNNKCNNKYICVTVMDTYHVAFLATIFVAVLTNMGMVTYVIYSQGSGSSSPANATLATLKKL